jgi:hypothetical protein
MLAAKPEGLRADGLPAGAEGTDANGLLKTS